MSQTNMSQTKNYSYHLGPPKLNSDAVHDQLRLANHYRNQLVEIELRRRAAVDDIICRMCPGLTECEAELADIERQIQDVIDQQRGRNMRSRASTDDAACRERLDQLRKNRREIASKRRDLRKEYFQREDTQAALQEAAQNAIAGVKQARADSDLHWGTRGIIEQAADAFKRGAPPVYRRFTGEGRIAVQIQRGISWDDAMAGTDTRLRLIHTPRTEPKTAANGKVLPAPQPTRQQQQYTLWMRIGSDAARQPVWATWPLLLHRLNRSTRIMWATVHRRLIAGKERWQLILTLRDDSGDAFAVKNRPNGGIAGIDIGYRLMPDGRQRVAYWAASDGCAGELAMPADTMAKWERGERLQSTRDDIHHDAVHLLREFLRHRDAPDWLQEDTQYMHSWRRPSHLDAIVRRWGSHRFDGDADIYQMLAAWRERERHLWQYQTHERDQLIARRKNIYRNFAAEMRRRYRTIAIEDINLNSAIHDVERDPMDRDTVTAQRRVARWAALSVLVQALRDCGAQVVTVERAGTTDICSWCNTANDVGAQLMHTCIGCGRRWDRDANAARNILARGEAGQDPQGPFATQPPQGLAPTNGDARGVSRSERFATARKRRPKTNTDKAQ